ncbi:MAG: cytochrome C [Chloroflexi bacterium]|nr:MAG: cytochrome C [Chloroflexota bacterium]
MTHIVSRRVLIFLTGILLLIVVSGVTVGVALGQSAEPAPATGQIPYSHRVHVEEVGISCLFCHNEALTSPRAGLPSLETCMICHAYITVDDEAKARAEEVVQAFENGTRVQWPDVYKQPDFVYFNHRPHIVNGVACQTCHGNVQDMDVVEATVNANMGFCLNCHRDYIKQHPDMSETEKNRLTDCITCHK